MDFQSQYNYKKSNNIAYPTTKKLIESSHVTDYKNESEEENLSENSIETQKRVAGINIKQMLKEDGPIIKAVILKQDGTQKEIDYDTTPRLNQVTKILQASPTIVGQYEEIEVIVVRGIILNKNIGINKNILKWPLNHEKIRGDIMLYRVDQDGKAIDFTLNEYKIFLNKKSEDIKLKEEWEKQEKQELSSNQDEYSDILDYDDEDYNDNDNDTEDDKMVSIDKIESMLSKKTKEQFKQMYGRDGTEEELSELTKEALKRFLAWNQQQLEKEEFDGTYDPKDDENQEDEDEQDDENEDENVYTDDEYDQSKQIKANEFELYRETEEYDEAIAAAQCLAANDRAKILQLAREEYIKDFGQDVPIDLLQDGFNALKVTLGFVEDDEDEEEEQDKEQEETEETEEQVEQDDEQDDQDVDVDESDEEIELPISEDELRKELQEAFDHIRELGKSQQPELVDKICETFIEINGEEPSSEELIDIFKRIKETFEEEAQDEVLDNVVENIEKDDEEEDDGENKDGGDESEEVGDYTVSSELTSSQKRVALIVDAKTSKDLRDYARYAIDQDIEESAKEEFSILSGREPTKDETMLLLVQLSTTSFLEASFSDDESDYDSSYDPSDENEKNQIEKDEQDEDDYYQTDDGESDEYEVDKSNSDDESDEVDDEDDVIKSVLSGNGKLWVDEDETVDSDYVPEKDETIQLEDDDISDYVDQSDE